MTIFIRSADFSAMKRGKKAADYQSDAPLLATVVAWDILRQYPVGEAINTIASRMKARGEATDWSVVSDFVNDEMIRLVVDPTDDDSAHLVAYKSINAALCALLFAQSYGHGGYLEKVAPSYVARIGGYYFVLQDDIEMDFGVRFEKLDFEGLLTGMMDGSLEVDHPEMEVLDSTYQYDQVSDDYTMEAMAEIAAANMAASRAYVATSALKTTLH